MREKNLVKICSIVGFFLAEIYMVFAVLAPYSPGKASRMFVPEALIPEEPNVAPGTQPPLRVQITRLAVCAIFFGPFGAMVGCGIGLLLDGARRALRKEGPKPNVDPPATPNSPPPPKDPGPPPAA
jgi:hypothetical protein